MIEVLKFSDYSIERLGCIFARDYMRENHYSKSCHNRPSPCYGLLCGNGLIGALCFATPCSERVRASVFGAEHKSRVTELHRLYVDDYYCGKKTPTGTESWFISRCLKYLKREKPQIWAVLTFADSTVGHSGIIYKATNARFCGMTAKSTFYLDGDGRLRHPRQNGVNISIDDARRRGWTPVKRSAKSRYLYLLPDSKSHKKKLESICKL